MPESDKASTVVATPQSGSNPQPEKQLSRPSSVAAENQPPNNVPDLEKAASVAENQAPADENNETDSQTQPSRPIPEGYKEFDDPNIVNWDGPYDPENPHNWKTSKKVGIVCSVAVITFLTPLGSSMFAPGVAEVMKEYKSTNTELASFVVSVYLLGFSFGPLLIAPLSELYGRAPLYHICNILFTIFTIACAVADSLESLIVFRFLAGSAGSAPLTIGAGTLADMIGQEKRGAAMAAWAMGPLLGPVIGPVAGGYLTEAASWRWSFWAIAIAAGVVTLNTFYWMTESYHTTLLARKTKKLIKETGNTNLKSALDSGKSPRDLFVHSIVRPTKMLFLSPIVLLLSIYVAMVYGYLYLLFTTISGVFQGQYGFSQGNVGLAFLGIGIGSILGLATLAYLSDRTMKHLSAKNGGEMKPEFRLPPLIPGCIFIPVGLFWYGWSAENNLHYVMPIAGTLWVGVGMIIVFMAVSTYLVDAYTVYAASAMAANTVLRSVVGALLPLCGVKMYDALGLGWGNSLLAFIALAMAPLPVVFYRYGERIRTSKRFRVNF